MTGLGHKVIAGVDISQLIPETDPTTGADDPHNAVESSYSYSGGRAESNGSARSAELSYARYAFVDADNGCAPLATDSMGKVLQRFAESIKEGLSSTNFWLDCQAPELDDVIEFCKTAMGGLHPLTLDLLAHPQRHGSLQQVGSYLFVSFGMEYAAIVSRRGVVSISRGTSILRGPILQLLQEDRLQFNPSWICYAVVAQITQTLLPVARRLDLDTAWVNEHVYVAFDDADGKSVLDRLASTRHLTVNQLTLLRSWIEIVESLSLRQENGSSELAQLYGAQRDSLSTMKCRLEAHESLLGNTHRNWMAVTQMNSEKTKTKILVVVGQFLALATVFVPMLTVFTAAHMNLEGPGMDSKDTKSLAWWGVIVGLVVAFMVLTVSASYAFFRRIMRRPPPSLAGR